MENITTWLAQIWVGAHWTDIFLFASMIFGVSANAVGLYSVYKTGRTNDLRKKFRIILSERRGTHDPNEDERQLAKILAFGPNGHSENPSKDHLERYLTDYIIDIDFKPKFYNYVNMYLEDAPKSSENQIFAKQLLQSWRETAIDLEKDVAAYLDLNAGTDPRARAVKRFIFSRDSYFERKKATFIEDIEDAYGRAAKVSLGPVSSTIP